MYFAERDVVSAKVIVEQLGGRLKQARLNQNITQEAIADRIGVNRRTIINAEKGQATLETFVAIMQVLDLTNQLNMFLPVQAISPIQLAKLQGNKRQRASGDISDGAKGVEEGSEW